VSTRTLRRWWFAGLWFLLPWPIFAFGDAFVPAVRYAILGIVATAVGIAEGTSGPVGMIIALFAIMTVGTTLGCWLLAWIVAKVLSLLPPAAARRITWLAMAGALAWALFFEPYRTHFGRAARGGLLAVLS